MLFSCTTRDCQRASAGHIANKAWCEGQHSLHDSLRMRNPDPAAVLGHQLSPSPERRRHGYLIPRARGVPQQPSSHVNLSAAMWGLIVPCAGSRSLDTFGPKEQPSSSRALLDRSTVESGYHLPPFLLSFLDFPPGRSSAVDPRWVLASAVPHEGWW